MTGIIIRIFQMNMVIGNATLEMDLQVVEGVMMFLIGIEHLTVQMNLMV